MASIKKRPDGKWRARYRDSAGKEHARHFPRKVDAQRWLDEVAASVVTGRYVDPRRGRTLLPDYASQWLAAQPIRPTSRRTWASYLRNHIEPAFAGRALASITRTEVLAFRRRLEAALSPNTSRSVVSLLAGILAAAVEDGYIARSPAAGTVPVRPERGKVEPLTPAQVQALVEAAPARYRAVVILGAGCGLRIGETLGLRRDRVRFLERELDVVEQLVLVPGAPPYLAPPKTRGSVRTVPLPAVVADALAAHLAEFPAEPLDLVFRTRVGTAVWPNTFNGSVWRPLRERAGLPDVRFHDLRHHYASLLIRYGESVKTVASLLGHSDELEVLRTYSHLWPDSQSRARAAIDQVYAGSPDPADSLRTEGEAPML